MTRTNAWSYTDQPCQACDGQGGGTQRRTIRIWFTDFWKGFDRRDNFFLSVLSACGFRWRLSRWRPDLLVYSCFGSTQRNYSCRKLFYTGENISVNFDECDYAISFDYSDSEFHLRLPVYIYHAWYQSRLLGLKGGVHEISQLLTATIPSEHDLLAGKDKFCAFIFGNGNVERRNI